MNRETTISEKSDDRKTDTGGNRIRWIKLNVYSNPSTDGNSYGFDKALKKKRHGRPEIKRQTSDMKKKEKWRYPFQSLLWNNERINDTLIKK